MRFAFSFLSILVVVALYLFYFRAQLAPGEGEKSAAGTPVNAAAALKQAHMVADHVKQQNQEAASY